MSAMVVRRTGDSASRLTPSAAPSGAHRSAHHIGAHRATIRRQEAVPACHHRYMARDQIGIPANVYEYVVSTGLHEPEILARLRDETGRPPRPQMQVPREEGAFLRLLAQLSGARRVLEIGTFTGYSSLAMALGLPADGRIVCCDISEEFTSIARRYWAEAGVADRIELRL